MATKRSPPKDLSAPSVHSKQPRLEVPSQLMSKPISVPQYSKQGSPLPMSEFSSSVSVPPSTSQDIGTSARMITNSVLSPGKGSFELYSQAATSSAAFVPPVTPLLKPPKTTAHDSERGPSIAPSFVLPVGVEHSSQPQLVCGGPLRPALISPAVVSTVVGRSPLVSVSSGTMVSPAMLLNPPPPYLTAGPALNVSHGQGTAELLPQTESSPELTCSSPSQFLHPPTSVCVPSAAQLSSSPSSPVVSTSVTENRQPVCPSEERINNSGSHKMVKLKVVKYHRSKLASLKLKHEVELKEKFFLESGGNMMDIVSWKKRPNSKRDKYLKRYDIDSSTSSYDHVLSPDNQENIPSQPGDEEIKLKKQSALKPKADSKHFEQQRLSTVKSEPEETSVTSTTIQIPLSTVSPSMRGGTPSSPVKTPQLPTASPRHVTRLHASFSSIYESSHEDIVMRARHEAEVMRAIAELRKEGLWSSSRLPKVQEPHRRKSHWDYLLEEMQWLATDFANERRWKINAAKKVKRNYVPHSSEK